MTKAVFVTEKYFSWRIVTGSA